MTAAVNFELRRAKRFSVVSKKLGVAADMVVSGACGGARGLFISTAKNRYGFVSTRCNGCDAFGVRCSGVVCNGYETFNFTT